MAFTADWGSAGVYFNGLGVFAQGDPDINGNAPSYKIDWGDGQSDRMTATTDSNGDGTADVNIFHSYGSDGTYDISVSSVRSGLPAEHLRAFCYTSATGDLNLGGSFRDDMMLCGSGNDTINTGDGNNWAFGRDGNDTLKGGSGFDFLGGEVGDDTLKGGAGGDLLTGGDGSDQLDGGDDGDSMYGDGGNDRLSGGAGDDYLDGGSYFGSDTGKDYLIGGAGADRFAFDAVTSAKPVDRGSVQDFTQGEDHIVLANVSSSISFVGQSAFDGASPEARYEQKNSSTTLFVDTDGNGKADFSVKFVGLINLTDSDFYYSFASPAAKPSLFAHAMAHVEDLAMPAHAMARVEDLTMHTHAIV